MSRVYIILVNWNGWRNTLECIESLLLLTYPDYRIVVSDNGSTDDTLQNLSCWAHDTSISYSEYCRSEARSGGDLTSDVLLTLIRNDENLGFAGGNNVGMQFGMARGDADYFWLLNNDTVVEPDSLHHLVNRMQENRSIGICGSTIRLYHNREKIQALGGGYYCRWLGLPWHYGRNRLWQVKMNPEWAESRMNYVEGASMLVSCPFIEKVGLLSEEYFLYFEEADWAIRSSGLFTLGYAPRSVVYHKVGASIGTSSNPARKSFVCDYFNVRNRIRFARRYYPVTLPTIYLVLVGEVFLRVICRKFDRAAMIIGLMARCGHDLDDKP